MILWGDEKCTPSLLSGNTYERRDSPNYRKRMIYHMVLLGCGKYLCTHDDFIRYRSRSQITLFQSKIFKIIRTHVCYMSLLSTIFCSLYNERNIHIIHIFTYARDSLFNKFRRSIFHLIKWEILC